MSTLPRELWQPGHSAVCVWVCGCCGDNPDEEGDVLVCRTCGWTYDRVSGQAIGEVPGELAGE
jgi:hypothetical protein